MGHTQLQRQALASRGIALPGTSMCQTQLSETPDIIRFLLEFRAKRNLKVVRIRYLSWKRTIS